MRSRSTGRGARRPLPLLVLGLGAALCLPVSAQAGPLARALDHLSARQDPVGGGFAVGPGTDPTYTEWAALAVAAAGEDTRRWRRGRASLRAALVRPMEGTTLAEVERAAVALAAAGLDPRVATDRNLVREVLQAQRTDGTIGPDPSTTAWGILALTSGGLGRDSRAVSDAAEALRRIQRPDGGWALNDADPRSGPNTTAAAIQALIAAGHDAEGSFTLRRARLFLLSAQNADGGFPPVVGGPSTALTTAWVSLSIRALGERGSRAPWDRAGGPLAYLRSLQRPDGGVRNAAEATEASVWATSQAALAFSGKYLPHRRLVPRPVPLRAPWVVSRPPVRAGGLVLRFRDDPGGTGVDPAAVRLRVAGRDVTSRAVVTAAGLRLPGSLVPRGRPTASLVLADRAGNGRAIRWRLIAPPDR
jgi:hypothetical protein